MYGAFSPHDGKSDFIILPSMDAINMSLFLKEISDRYPNEFICMFTDGASCHTSKELVVSERIRLEKLPPYSPDLNPSENVWDEIRESFFHNLAFDSMDAVESKLVEDAKHYENHPEIIQSITGWEWILSMILLQIGIRI